MCIAGKGNMTPWVFNPKGKIMKRAEHNWFSYVLVSETRPILPPAELEALMTVRKNLTTVPAAPERCCVPSSISGSESATPLVSE